MISVMAPERPLTEWQSLAEQFYSYLALSDAEMQRRCEDRIRFEQQLPEPDRYRQALLRLEAWLDLAVEDARVLARAYDDALNQLPPEFRLNSEEAERAAICNGLSFRDFRVLSGIVPWFDRETSTLSPHHVLEAVAA